MKACSHYVTNFMFSFGLQKELIVGGGQHINIQDHSRDENRSQ